MRALRTTALAFVLALSALPFAPVAAEAAVSIGISVRLAPPPLPVYAQPAIPGPGYHWVPGYWAWDADDDDYYWVPGYWTRPPRVGLLWTPGYWGWSNGAYVFHDGYWGRSVGFYGGVPYGFGYTGSGFDGGYWRGNTYYYNRKVTNITTNITSVYDRPVIVPPTRASFNGGTGGIVAKPTPAQLAAKKGAIAPTPIQMQHVKTSAGDKTLHAKTNKGNPLVAAKPVVGGEPKAAPGKPGAPGLVGAKPVKPGAPGVVAKPGTPGKPGAPGVAAKPGTPGKPGQPGVAAKPGTPGTAGKGALPTKPTAPGIAKPTPAKPLPGSGPQVKTKVPPGTPAAKGAVKTPPGGAAVKKVAPTGPAVKTVKPATPKPVVQKSQVQKPGPAVVQKRPVVQQKPAAQQKPAVQQKPAAQRPAAPQQQLKRPPGQ